jgi:hypothetical protein
MNAGELSRRVSAGRSAPRRSTMCSSTLADGIVSDHPVGRGGWRAPHGNAARPDQSSDRHSPVLAARGDVGSVGEHPIGLTQFRDDVLRE